MSSIRFIDVSPSRWCSRPAWILHGIADRGVAEAKAGNALLEWIDALVPTALVPTALSPGRAFI
jgi:hypothetical protein